MVDVSPPKTLFALEKSVHETLDTLYIPSAPNVITMSQARNDYPVKKAATNVNKNMESIHLKWPKISARSEYAEWSRGKEV